MKIAVYHNLPSGGAKRTLYEALRNLSIRHEFDVYSTSLANQTYADLGPFAKLNKVYPFSPGKLYNSPFGRFNMLVRSRDLTRIDQLNQSIAADLDRGKYDLILVHPCQIEIAPSILRYTQHAPTIYYCHEPPRIVYESMPYRPYDQKSSTRRLLDKIDPLPGWFFNRLKMNDHENSQQADLVLVNSKFTQQNANRIYGINSKVSYHGTDASLFHPQFIHRDRAILSVGSLTPLKNFDFIIQSLAMISPDQRPPLWIVSNFQNSPERHYLEELAAQLSVAVRFFGNISDQDLVNFYNRAAVTVYTPLREPFGLVPLESMACETPIITICEGGMQESVVEGETGWLVDRDPGQMAEKIMFVLQNPEIARKIGKNGRQSVLENWSWEQAATRLEGYFFDVIQRN